LERKARDKNFSRIWKYRWVQYYYAGPQMSVKLIILAGFLGVGAYVGYKISSYDESVVPYSKAEVQSRLSGEKLSFPRRDGDGTVSIWATGRTAKGIGLSMQYAADAPQIDCQAIVTQLGPQESRVAVDCGAGPAGSAIGQTETQLRAPILEEFALSKLHGRAFNRSRSDSKEVGAVMKNMGGMQREALKSADEAQRMQSEGGSSSSGGFGPDNEGGSE